MTVDQVMNRWPASIRVFMDFRMSCVGCPIATFHSVEEASREHAIDGGVFWRLRPAGWPRIPIVGRGSSSEF